ncbi:6-pyruvoyl tetrahydrobiopterin synthase [Frankia sp. CcI49]|uniref:6-pyruvoyl trahydropterin synthase family protein n=1 Tax=Frankia sp. CcI49 TaxID=1745382 RepID=UPI0009785E23|nr:6-carboxytetrahydropterin synthase [Frankia sp. CcI49]ONH58385.1 6-pyruvoyl tetrahydrobiopterin synthase [Frankia sp. CcI49]
MYEISKDFPWSASHVVDGLPEGHQCARLHGHNYVARVIMSAEKLDTVGFVVDYGALAPVKRWIDGVLDHRHLNDELEFNPTAENLARFLADLVPRLVEIPEGVSVSVAVSETPKTWATWRETS